MKWIILLIFSLGIGKGQAQAQEVSPLITAMTWEEASRVALKERKIVFAVVGVSPEEQQRVRKLFSNESLGLFLSRNTVGIAINMQTVDNEFFERKLLMSPWPAYAFFMPYGDLLESVPVKEVGGNADKLLEVGREALRRAEIRKNNSRSVDFREGKLENLLAEADSDGKLLFVMGRTDTCWSCLFMEKNVLNLDKVADFYNSHFISVRTDTFVSGDLHYPYYFFLNESGKIVHAAEGLMDEEIFIEMGKTALKKAEGVVFETVAFDSLLVRASREGKGVFLDLYFLTGAERKQLEKKIWRDPRVAEFWERHFVSGSYSVQEEEGRRIKEKYALAGNQFFCFVDAEGNIQHQIVNVESAEELLGEAQRVLAGNGWKAMSEKYRQGERSADFIEEYIRTSGRAGRMKQAGEAASSYLSGLGGDSLRKAKYWELYRTYVTDARSELFLYVRVHRAELGTLYGQEAVERKIREIWQAGAGDFVQETDEGWRFDELAFKEYVKGLKKEKVDGWRIIARAARMDAAEKTGDWRTYTELAEERWNEEKISEAELYGWGVKINENCLDKSIRFKAARWFAVAAADMERKERLTGKINLSSYKGFFEKLVDELVQ
ncbi:DUF255 domain-containing protein [Odoribacter lunatus]|uniref:DUF255 domain-containing protein n=1 Tax=Odoribacter lunatus TaxID=2941335 RepID=UPI00203D7B52|nr:DUF255 domain-containing protein [Odoribacter lunatus]